MQRTVLRPIKKKFVYRCQGILDPKAMRRLARKLIAFIGMSPARRGRIDPYPYRGGGGNGWTGFFPLMESYIMIDVYTQVNETEILISTCKPERVVNEAVKSFLSKEIGSVMPD